MAKITPEQKLFLQLIIRSHLSWDYRSLERIRELVGAKTMVLSTDDFQEVMLFGAEQYRITCVGCGNIIGAYTSDYPTNLPHCPLCTCSPLKISSPLGESHVWAGIAKLTYIDQALHFPNDYVRDQVINQVLTGGRTCDSK